MQFIGVLLLLGFIYLFATTTIAVWKFVLGLVVYGIIKGTIETLRIRKELDLNIAAAELEYKTLTEKHAYEELILAQKSESILTAYKTSDGSVKLTWCNALQDFNGVDVRIFRTHASAVDSYADAQNKGELLVTTEEANGTFTDHKPSRKGGDYYYTLFLIYQDKIVHKYTTHVQVHSQMQREINRMKAEERHLNAIASNEKAKAQVLQSMVETNRQHENFAGSEQIRLEIEQETGLRINRRRTTALITHPNIKQLTSSKNMDIEQMVASVGQSIKEDTSDRGKCRKSIRDLFETIRDDGDLLTSDEKFLAYEKASDKLASFDAINKLEINVIDILEMVDPEYRTLIDAEPNYEM